VCDSGKRVTEQFKQEIDLTARRNTAMAQLVRDLMTSEPVALPADTPVRQAAQAMREHDIGDVLVVDNGELRGIVTDRDIVIRGLADWEDVSTCSLGDVCSDQLLTATPDDDIDTAIARMREASVRRIPVVENGTPVGVLSIGDAAIERDPNSALAEISVDEGNT
jgi:CBS domain-containing protein